MVVDLKYINIVPQIKTHFQKKCYKKEIVNPTLLSEYERIRAIRGALNATVTKLRWSGRQRHVFLETDDSLVVTETESTVIPPPGSHHGGAKTGGVFIDDMYVLLHGMS